MTYGVTADVSGKKLMTVANASKRHPAILSGTPHRPSDHRACGSGAPKSLLQSMQPILIEYENSMAAPTKPTILLNASVLPRTMRERTTVMVREPRIELIGMGTSCTTFTF